MTTAAEVGGSADVILMDDVSGTVVAIAVTRGRQLSLDRVLVFMADGVTLWYDRDFVTASHHPDVSWTVDGRAQRVRVSVHTAQDLEPAEHLAGAAAEFRVPVTVDLSLGPISLPVPRQRAFADGGLVGSEVYRASGSVAAGSVVASVRGQAWVGATGFAASGTEDGTRLIAAFQDGSAMLATAPQEPGAVGPGAFQERTVTSPLTVSVLNVEGPSRRIPTRMICQLDGTPSSTGGYTVTGGYRSLDQHLAFVRASADGQGWVRRAFTPYDVSRSGVTGFGLLEQVGRVSSPNAPSVVGTGIPETF
ncbi:MULTISPECIES: hypothetical protein [Mumia]|uniref:Uncharacterized protein n=1 Tax=Mumia xiangluensis TaxID=1678900 RepID=A0ABW1QHK8_9ACTN|nr:MULTISPECIES: hypothetical protein [Mumia]